MKKTIGLVVLGVVGLSAFGGAKYVQQVRIEGKLATTDILTRNGKTYVPLSDVAKALGLVVQRNGSHYDLVKPGGANMVQGLRGKIGDELFNGKYRFKLVEVVRGSVYKPRFAQVGYDFTPGGSGNDLVAVICRLKNGTKEAVTFDLTQGKNTALTDENEQSYGNYAGATVDMVNRGPRVLPGAAVDFALIFEVPKAAVLKDMVFSVNDLSGKPNPDFRISLKP